MLFSEKFEAPRICLDRIKPWACPKHWKPDNFFGFLNGDVNMNKLLNGFPSLAHQIQLFSFS
jgi:hypothetical protein